MILRRIWLPFSGGVCALGVVHAKGKELECDPNRGLIRPSDLPLYGDEKQCSHCIKKKAANELAEDKGMLEETITCARKELWLLMEQARVIKGEVAEAMSYAIGSANEGLEFLRKEENFVPRMGAIGLGGLTGFVYGLRKGMFRRMLYTAVGAGTMAALCYPREAQEYSRLAYDQARMYTMVAYHFLNGVSRDLTGYQLPPLSLGHFLVSDSPHPPPEAVPSAEHLLPPTVTPVHIPLPGEEEILFLAAGLVSASTFDVKTPSDCLTLDDLDTDIHSLDCKDIKPEDPEPVKKTCRCPPKGTRAPPK